MIRRLQTRTLLQVCGSKVVPLPVQFETVGADYKVLVPIHFTPEFIKRCKRGSSFECVLAFAIEDYEDANPRAFPHPVIAAYVKEDVVYLITERPKPAGPGLQTYPKAKRCGHNFNLMERWDTLSKRKFFAKYRDQTIIVCISSPRDHGVVGHRDVGGSEAKATREKVATAIVNARAARAGAGKVGRPPKVRKPRQDSGQERLADGSLRRAINAGLLLPSEAHGL